ncbi:MAG: preprotein translocase subunit SecG [Bacteroidota bacterium]|nr:preprotein translocase subunit SecG [Bacteroidota bacterium]
MLYLTLTIIIAIICALLIVVVLLQNGSGQGLSGIGATSMGGSSGLGARRTADLLSKATSYLGGIFLFLCVLANFVIDRPESQNSILQSGAPLMQDNTMPPMPTFDNSSTGEVSVPIEE